jgi:ArsR family metal-binding transcriptional regulator
MTRDKVEKGLLLLKMVNTGEITLREAREILEAVTRVPKIIREILHEGERQGLIKRERNRVYIKSSVEHDFKTRIKKYRCLSHCTRCGRRITTCYYFVLGDDELGPYGCECIRRLRLL